MESFRLDGRRALVTGGSKGIGVGLARGLAEAGADIVLMARNEKELEQTRDVLQETGRSIGIASSDLSRPEEIPQVYADVEAQHGPVDILVNNAGTTYRSP
ncbi:MAG: SDR family NAD(P)-dependent oxidoreductase, partial [Pirellulaceae bacterium]|nr:SDR family NAD(P)-dependent oxidoreductase [Pirellulaceae bacterium]